MDIIVWFVLAAVMLLWWIQNRAKTQQLDQALDLLSEELSNLMLVTLEPVTQGSHDVVLVYEYATLKFLCQGSDTADCEQQLRRIFPNHRILVVTDEEA